MTDKKITVKLAAGIGMVLALDCPGIRASYPVETRCTSRHIFVTGTRKALEKVIRDCSDRHGDGALGHWDQPLAWAKSSKAAEKRIRAALAENKSS